MPAPAEATPRADRRDPIPREIWILVGSAFVIAVGFGNVAALVGLSQSVISADIQVCSLAHVLSLSIPLV